MDANAIRSLNIAMITLKQGADRILATTPDVQYEVSSLTRKISLLHLEALNAAAYVKMREILSRESVRNVVDYYYNKGTADVCLLAHALTVGGVGIFSDKIIIVTNDKKLHIACDDLDIKWKTVEEFRSL